MQVCVSSEAWCAESRQIGFRWVFDAGIVMRLRAFSCHLQSINHIRFTPLILSSRTLLSITWFFIFIFSLSCSLLLFVIRVYDVFPIGASKTFVFSGIQGRTFLSKLHFGNKQAKWRRGTQWKRAGKHLKIKVVWKVRCLEGPSLIRNVIVFSLFLVTWKCDLRSFMLLLYLWFCDPDSAMCSQRLTVDKFWRCLSSARTNSCSSYHNMFRREISSWSWAGTQLASIPLFKTWLGVTLPHSSHDCHG